MGNGSGRTLLNPTFLDLQALRSHIPAATYWISRLCEVVSLIKTVKLRRYLAKDASVIKKLLEESDLATCPEGDHLPGTIHPEVLSLIPGIKPTSWKWL